MSSDNISVSWLRQLVQGLQASHHRALIILSGEPFWCQSAARHMLSGLTRSKCLWLGSAQVDVATIVLLSQVQQVLGNEFEAVVYDGYEGFDADAFAAVTGTIRGGGLCILLTPPLIDWPRFADPVYQKSFPSPRVLTIQQQAESAFLVRFIQLAQQHPGVYCLEQGQSKLPVLPGSCAISESLERSEKENQIDYQDQALAIDGIINVVKGHRRRPLVLTSDRGRGKSAALGIAAAQLLQQGVQRILVTAPRLEALASLFRHAKLILVEGELSRGKFHFNQGVIEYIPPDVLIEQKPLADFLMIDEAAALPNAMLEELLRCYSRLVFATTVHGYEGTGRGFSLRFFNTLDHYTPGWKLLRLQQPIRWRENDPLEAFIFRALLLNSDISSTFSRESFDLSHCVIETITGAKLARQETKLSQVFGLLMLAHYRTRPNDLRQLLDNSQLIAYIARCGETVLGVALVIHEGGLDKSDQEAVYLGTRRLRGHLLSQTLLAHLGLFDVGDLRFARIMRIAVHPEFQNLGIGSQLVTELVRHLQLNDDDVVGASFGLTTQILPFWRRAGFDFVRHGLTREHTTGCHSGILLRALSTKAEPYVLRAGQRFWQSWPYLLRGPLCDIDARLVAMLSARKEGSQPVMLSENEWREVEAFAYGQRGYEMSMAVLEKLTWRALSQGLVNDIGDQSLGLLIGKLIQNKAWVEFAQHLGFAGKQQAIDALRVIFQQVILKIK